MPTPWPGGILVGGAMHAGAQATLLIGFLLGLRHATDLDHIVAVSTLVTEGADARRGARIGLSWGTGHLLTVFAAGGLLILLRARVSPQIEWSLEFFVALVLIWLGASTVRHCLTGHYHFHRHQHGDHAHAHLHFHARSEPGHVHDDHAEKFARSHPGSGMKPLLLGVVHGLAGTAGLTLLVLTSIPSRKLGLGYLFVFGFGALVGMVVFGTLLGLPLARAARGLPWLRAIRLTAGAGSFALGTLLAYRAFLPQSWPF